MTLASWGAPGTMYHLLGSSRWIKAFILWVIFPGARDSKSLPSYFVCTVSISVSCFTKRWLHGLINFVAWSIWAWELVVLITGAHTGSFPQVPSPSRSIIIVTVTMESASSGSSNFGLEPKSGRHGQHLPHLGSKKRSCDCCLPQQLLP